MSYLLWLSLAQRLYVFGARQLHTCAPAWNPPAELSMNPETQITAKNYAHDIYQHDAENDVSKLARYRVRIWHLLPKGSHMPLMLSRASCFAAGLLHFVPSCKSILLWLLV